MNPNLQRVQRVLMTADTVGGVWTYSLELAAGLARNGLDVGLATMGSPLSPAQRQEADRVPSLRIFESSYKLEWMDDPWGDVARAGDWLLTLENEFAPDVVHLNGFAHGNLPWRAPHIVVGHSCVLSWWRAVKGEDAPSDWDTYRERVATGLQAADLVVAPSRSMLSELQRYYGPFSATAVVPNGRDPARAVVLQKEPLVFAAGRAWDEAKNIGALSSVSDRIEWPVCVAGDDRHPGGGRRPIAGVTMLGHLDAGAVSAWLSRAAIYCLPALYEPFGLSVLEAALSGCALVLGDIPSLRENWEGAAVLVKPGDDVALAAELQALISNSTRRRALAALAYSRALRFTPEQMVAGYLEAYNAVVAPDFAPASNS
jgi:glycosyltransferase involved in cell wall biosynthesis